MMRYPSLMRMQVVSMWKHLKISSLVYVAVLNAFECRLARTADPLGVEKFRVKNRDGGRPTITHFLPMQSISIC